MKKKIILILFISCILCGCTSIQSKSIESIVNESVSKNLRVYNTYRKGYKYNLAKGLCSVDSSDFNEVIASRDYKYYLYVDGVSYYNKVIEKYEERKEPYYSILCRKDSSFKIFLFIFFIYHNFTVRVVKPRLGGAVVNGSSFLCLFVID